MNRVFKTKWSAAHQQYVVTDEHRATKGKASKSAVALTVAALMMAGAHAAYMEPCFEASRYHEVDQAQQSWGNRGISKGLGSGCHECFEGIRPRLPWPEDHGGHHGLWCSP